MPDSKNIAAGSCSRLIDAAPDLLEALKELCACSLMPIHPYDRARFDLALVNAGFAIDKAEGRS